MRGLLRPIVHSSFTKIYLCCLIILTRKHEHLALASSLFLFFRLPVICLALHERTRTDFVRILCFIICTLRSA